VVSFTLRPLNLNAQAARIVSQQISKRDLRSSDTSRNITGVTGCPTFRGHYAVSKNQASKLTDATKTHRKRNTLTVPM